MTLATGGIIGVQVLKGQQDADYLAEVPLIALMFLVMVLHGRRRLAAAGTPGFLQVAPVVMVIPAAR